MIFAKKLPTAIDVNGLRFQHHQGITIPNVTQTAEQNKPGNVHAHFNKEMCERTFQYTNDSQDKKCSKSSVISEDGFSETSHCELYMCQFQIENARSLWPTLFHEYIWYTKLNIEVYDKIYLWTLLTLLLLIQNLMNERLKATRWLPSTSDLGEMPTLNTITSTSMYFKKNKNKQGNYTILKENESNEFSLDYEARRTLVGEKPFFML